MLLAAHCSIKLQNHLTHCNNSHVVINTIRKSPELVNLQRHMAQNLLHEINY